MRYTYWIEDLQGLVQYDKIGYYRVEPDWVSAPTYSQGNSGHGFNAESFGASIGDSLLLGFPAGDPRHADPKRGGRILDRFFQITPLPELLAPARAAQPLPRGGGGRTVRPRRPACPGPEHQRIHLQLPVPLLDRENWQRNAHESGRRSA